MRGYFGIGVERINKPYNVGSLFRSAHAFGASFTFTVAASYSPRRGRQSDTSKAAAAVPFYAFPDLDAMMLPQGCALVGVEFLDDAVDMPSFHHPANAAYVLGPERDNLSPGLLARCDHVIKIPTRFCLNVAITGALVMYDRQCRMGRFAPRPLLPGGPTQDVPDHVHGGPLLRTTSMEAHRAPPPLAELDVTETREKSGAIKPESLKK